jgi:hypothetical protein
MARLRLGYAYDMARLSPTREGFRAAFRRPLFTFAEITWRWVVGATATVLILFGFFEFLGTLPVNNAELLFLNSRQPFLISRAIAHILRGGFYRGFLSLLLAVLLLSLLWIIAASLGRIAVARAVLDYARGYIAQKATTIGLAPAESEPLSGRSPWHALLRLNFLRVSLVLAAITAFWGASIIAGFASSNADPQPGLVFLIFLPIATAIGLVSFCLNWLLSLASFFAVRDGEDAIDAINAAVGLCRERTGAVVAVSSWTGLAHLVAMVVATTVVSVPLSVAVFVPWRLFLLAMILLMLIYFAVADWIYTARLAGYAFIMEMPEAFWIPPLPPPAVPQPPPAVRRTIDKDELILSDLPNLVTES